MVPVPIIYLNKKAQSYTHLQVTKCYIALNSETYISLGNQELRMYKKIGYEFYCKELFVVKHKSKYSYESVIYFSLGSDKIKQNCNFAYYYNDPNIKPAVLDGGNEIILVNLPNNKHTESSINNDIPVKIPSFPYVLLNRSVLCHCEIEIEQHFLLESLGACQDSKFKLTMYFTVNLAFIKYFDNLVDSLKFPIFFE